MLTNAYELPISRTYANASSISTTMLVRRTHFTSSPTLRLPSTRSRSPRINSGNTRSLLTMVDSAMTSTMIMPVAADSPPRKAASASHE